MLRTKVFSNKLKNMKSSFSETVSLIDVIFSGVISDSSYYYCVKFDSCRKFLSQKNRLIKL